MLNSAFEHVTRIRCEKYGLDEHGNLNGVNPLASDLRDSIDHLAQGLYTRNAHFIFELVQNAEDNAYGNNIEPSLTFRLLRDDPTKTPGADGVLIVENNELGFSPENIDAICAVGKSTKKKQEGFIGEKGIGFKSIFRVTSIPFLFSNGYRISLPKNHKETGLGFIVPEWVENIPQIIDTSITSIVLPLDQQDFGYDVIKKMLWEIEPETILFLSKLKEIKIVTDHSEGFTVIKDDNSEPNIQLLTNKNGYDEIFEFLLFKRIFDKPKDINHEKRTDVKEREVSIAFPVGEKPNSAGKLFAYLPVRYDTGFPFIINADFILPSSREDIQDTPWNREWLMPCVGELVSISLPILKDNKQLSVSFLYSLAKSVLLLNENNMYYPLAKAVKEAFTTLELIPADDGSFVSARNAKLASADWLRKLLRGEQLKLLYQKELKWVHGDITDKGRHELWKYMREELKIEELTPDGFARRVDVDFFCNQNNQWMINFYINLQNQKTLWKEGASWDSGPLRKKPFIRLQDGSHVCPFNDDGIPNVYLPKKTLVNAQLPTIAVEIASHDEARRFLISDLKIPEFDIVAEVLEHVLPKYKSLHPPQTDEHLLDIEKIVEALSIDSQEKRKRLNDALQNTPFILSRLSNSDSESYQIPDHVYFPNNTLKMYFSGNSAVNYLHSIYQRCSEEILARLGVRNEVRIDKRKQDFQGYIIIRDDRGRHERGLCGFDADITVEGLSIALSSPTPERSLYIWNKIVLPNFQCIRGTIEKSTRETYAYSSKDEIISEAFGRLLIESKWLPGTDGHFLCPAEVSLDELPEQYERSEKLADLLGMKKDVVAKLAEEAGVKPEILEYARNNQQEIEKLIARDAARKDRPTFPARPVANPERRQERLGEQLSDAPDKEYEKRERSVQVPTEITDEIIKTWLRNQYVNDDEQMVCQICKMEHFRKRNGEHHFEKKEVLTSKFLPKKLVAQYLALCPLCAAKYDEFVKTDDEVMAELRDRIVSSDLCEIPISLGDEKTSIRFVETHLHDLKNILEEMGQSAPRD